MQKKLKPVIEENEDDPVMTIIFYQLLIFFNLLIPVKG